MNAKLADPKFKDKAIYHFCSSHPHKRANSCFLIAAWSVLYQNKTPEEAFRPFRSVSPPFPTWHDATPTVCSFTLTILDTLNGLYKAREHRFFDLEKFNIEEYEYYEQVRPLPPSFSSAYDPQPFTHPALPSSPPLTHTQSQVENGDLNWCLEGKFLAFAGPHATHEVTAGGYHSLCPDDYVNYFKRKNVQLVIRLNKKYYDAKRFTNHGIEHMELYFLDGSNPPDHLLARFLDKVESTPGAVAVHCKAGLGRTGSCIGCYMMKHYKMTAEEVIGWLRVVRPGSIIGPQQQFMRDSQARMWKEGELARARLTSAPNLSLAAAALAPGSPGAEESERDARAAGRSAAAGKYAADRSIEAQGDVLRARRAQASPMGSPISPKASAASKGGGEDHLYASPSPGPNHGSPPSPGSPGKSSFGRFLGGWK